MTDETPRFQCATCGEVHEGLPTDVGFQMPDDIWDLPESERAARTKISPDLCRLDERYFIRCVLHVRLTDMPNEDFGWGVWAEVPEDCFFSYVALFDQDGSNVPVFQGILANAIRGHQDALGARVFVQFRDARNRPSLTFPLDVSHSLAQLQITGMNSSQHHDAVS